MFVLLSVWFRFNPLIYLIASILGANGVRMIMLSTAVELLVAFIPIVMILFGDLLPGTKNQLPQAEQ